MIIIINITFPCLNLHVSLSIITKISVLILFPWYIHINIVCSTQLNPAHTLIIICIFFMLTLCWVVRATTTAATPAIRATVGVEVPKSIKWNLIKCSKNWCSKLRNRCGFLLYTLFTLQFWLSHREKHHICTHVHILSFINWKMRWEARKLRGRVREEKWQSNRRIESRRERSNGKTGILMVGVGIIMYARQKQSRDD